MISEEMRNILNRLVSYSVSNGIAKYPVYLTNTNKIIDQLAEHRGSLLFKFRTEDILYNPHKFNDQQIKELSLLVPEYKFEPVVPKRDQMFYTGLVVL